MDEIDKKIITILQTNCKVSQAEIAKEVGMAPSAVFERIKKLEDKKIIQEYTARLNPKAVGKGLLAFVFIRSKVEKNTKISTGKALAAIAEVEEVHHIAGEDCYLVKVRTSDTDSLGDLLENKFRTLPTVVSTKTTIVLGTIKESSRIYLENSTSKKSK